MNYVHQQKPFVVPTTDGKTIEEHFGATTGNPDVSIAHMIVPAGWGEPHQNPAFDEWTLVSRGRKNVEVDGQLITVKAGESILVKKGARVRYSNPFEEECEYWSVCMPAFTVEGVNREEA